MASMPCYAVCMLARTASIKHRHTNCARTLASCVMSPNTASGGNCGTAHSGSPSACNPLLATRLSTASACCGVTPRTMTRAQVPGSTAQGSTPAVARETSDRARLHVDTHTQICTHDTDLYPHTQASSLGASRCCSCGKVLPVCVCVCVCVYSLVCSLHVLEGKHTRVLCGEPFLGVPGRGTKRLETPVTHTHTQTHAQTHTHARTHTKNPFWQGLNMA